MMLDNDVRERQPLRDELDSAVARFLASGGRIQSSAITERQPEPSGTLRERVAAA